MRGKLRKKFLVAWFAFSLILLTPLAAFANNFNGTYQNLSRSNWIEGVYATIGTAKYPVVYQNFSCAWPMVANSTNDLQYVQVGWMYRYGSSGNYINYFFEWNNGSPTNFSRTFSGTGPAQDSTHNY